jgi:hypothetical protein
VIVTVATLAIGAIVWAVRLEGRQQTTEAELAALRQRHVETVQEFREDLRYIRQRLDQVLDRGLR